MGNYRKSVLPRDIKATVEEIAPESKINTVRVQSLIDAHLYYTGQVSGELYEWRMAGTVVEVDERDVPELLSKRLGKKMCCGNGTNLIFQLA